MAPGTNLKISRTLRTITNHSLNHSHLEFIHFQISFHNNLRNRAPETQNIVTFNLNLWQLFLVFCPKEKKSFLPPDPFLIDKQICSCLKPQGRKEHVFVFPRGFFTVILVSWLPFMSRNHNVPKKIFSWWSFVSPPLLPLFWFTQMIPYS